LKQPLRWALNLPRYGPVALKDPQSTVEVWLEGPEAPRDVTANNVVASLRPFTVGIMLGESAPPPSEEQKPRLCFRDRSSQRLLGVLHLSPAGAIALPGYRFCLFEIKSCENYCVSRLQMRAYDLREQWRAERRQHRNPHNFRMSHEGIRCSHAFYICPRPVVLVTVEHGVSGNMFPMDLIGPTDSPWFSMALRLTSPAAELMRQSRRMALASVPFSYKEFAYRLGEHHRKASIDWNSLPFPFEPSPQFHLPVAKAALRTREVQVEECRTVGSHMLFLTSLVSDTHSEQAREKQLFHAFYGTRHSPKE